MVRIIDKKSTGKTGRLLLLAKENEGVVVCANPQSMRDHAYHYGLTGIDYVAYEEYIGFLCGHPHELCIGRKIFIDELDTFLALCSKEICGYTLSTF